MTLFVDDVDKFYFDYKQDGPMEANIEPMVAIARLKEFEERYIMNKRKFDIN